MVVVVVLVVIVVVVVRSHFGSSAGWHSLMGKGAEKIRRILATKTCFGDRTPLGPTKILTALCAFALTRLPLSELVSDSTSVQLHPLPPSR